MNTSPKLPKTGADGFERSYFDIPEYSEPFWKQIDASDFSDYPTYLQSEFFTRGPKGQQSFDSCSLSLQNNFLVHRKKKSSKTVEYVDLEEHMYKIIMITPQDPSYSQKYKFGFRIYANCNSFDFFCKDKLQIVKWQAQFRRFCVMSDFYENYQIFESLGTGGYGEVRLIQDKFSKVYRAGKFVRLKEAKSSKAEKQKVMILNEIKILRKLDHPNIVKIYDLYELEDQICIVMEYLEGERLLEYITKSNRLSERETAQLFKQMILVLSYLETMSVIHRDIKPENIMLVSDKHGKYQLKLIDFGLSTFIYSKDIIKRCGTPGYVAPEMLNAEPYDFKLDLYSAGVVFFICLLGKPPFYADNHKELLEKNRKGVFNYNRKHWLKLSSESRDLIQRLLEPFPANRITMDELLNNRWLLDLLTPEDRKHLSECAFHVVKMNVPDDKRISAIPTSCTGHLSKTTTGADFARFISVGGSHSFLMGDLASGNELSPTLNSFYKVPASRESVHSGDNSPLSSPNQKRFSGFGNAHHAATGIQTQNRDFSLFSQGQSINFSPLLKHEKSGLLKLVNSQVSTGSKLNIQVPTSTTNIWDEENTVIPDDEDDTCGNKYTQLQNQTDLFFGKLQEFQMTNSINSKKFP